MLSRLARGNNSSLLRLLSCRQAAEVLIARRHLHLQQLDYLEFIAIYGRRISGFHVKDAEFRPSGRVGVYGGYQPWAKRAGRFRSLGD